MNTIDYFDAWSRWIAGRLIDLQAPLLFMSVLWWGRAGKVVTFIGGLTVVLDIAEEAITRLAVPAHPS